MSAVRKFTATIDRHEFTVECLKRSGLSAGLLSCQIARLKAHTMICAGFAVAVASGGSIFRQKKIRWICIETDQSARRVVRATGLFAWARHP